MKRIFAVLSLFLLLTFANVAFASKIPTNELNYFKNTFKDLNVRFDGLIELSDGTAYIPVFPAEEKKVNQIQLLQTIPAKKTLKDKPDFILLNSNFAFFKLKKDEEKTTIVYNEDIPDNIKLGLLPQDLLVPQGFQIPGELRIIIGDLLIPVLPVKEYKEIDITTDKKNPKTNLSNATTTTINIEQLSDKYFYASSFNSNAITILNANTGKAFKKIEFASIPTDIKLSNDNNYLLVTTWKLGKIFVIAAKKATVLKEIEVGEKPSFIMVSNLSSQAYISNSQDGTISIIDLKNMKQKEKITVIGNPTIIELAENENDLYYLDAVTGKVYFMEKTEQSFEPYIIKPIFKANNLKKIQYYDGKIFTIDRGKNEMLVYHTKGKPQRQELINISDITPIEEEENDDVDNNKNTQNTNYEYYNKTNKKDKNIEKIPFKQKFSTWMKKLLYYKDDSIEQTKPIKNPDNQVQVLEEISILEPQTTVVTTKNKTLKQKFIDYMGYTYEKEEDPAELALKTAQAKIAQQIDFIKIDKRINDFLILNKKIYLLSADNYEVLIYDANTNNYIKSITLDNKGYYNSIKASKDGKLGVITNITSNELVLFDTDKDVVIQKLPLDVNVHNVVITRKK